jgi:hypothetical protein
MDEQNDRTLTARAKKRSRLVVLGAIEDAVDDRHAGELPALRVLAEVDLALASPADRPQPLDEQLDLILGRV